MPASTKYPGCIGGDVLMRTREQVCDPRLAAVPALALSQLGEWTSDLGHHHRMAAKQILKKTYREQALLLRRGWGAVAGRCGWARGVSGKERAGKKQEGQNRPLPLGHAGMNRGLKLSWS